MKGIWDTLGCFVLQGFAAFLAVLPLETAVGFGRLIGAGIFLFAGRKSVAYADLKAALGSALSEKERWQVIRSHYRHLGRMFVEILRLPSLDQKAIERILHIQDPAKPMKLIDQGVIYVTAHFGNWEYFQLGCRRLGRPDKKIHVLARHQKFPKINAFMNRLRESAGSFMVATRGMGIREMMRSLRRREWIGLLGDQDAGRDGGLIVPFFGRKTTIPTGAFELARRTHTPILPVFVVRREEIHQDIYLGDKIEFAKEDEPLEDKVLSYVRSLEDFIRKYPDHWLWEVKRWKYSWTKRILILSDGKPGHVKQSEAVAQQFQKISTQYGREGMEYPTATLEVQFKSKWHRSLFPWFAFFFIRRAQGRLRKLAWFFSPETQKAIEAASADFIISAGASLVPLNLCLARDSRAKSIVLMKPSFPFNLFRYDLAMVPAHDRGRMPDGAFRTLLTPSCMEPERISEAARNMAGSLRRPEKVKFAVFLGGPTRHFRLELEPVRQLFQALDRSASLSGDYLVTTSRRTPQGISDFIKREIVNHAHCQKVVIAAEDPNPGVAPGMMAIAPVILVTEDSISMISEAVSAGRKVIVLRLGSEGLPAKHKKFREILARESAIVIADLEDLEEKITALDLQKPPVIIQFEKEALTKRLQEIL